MKPATVILLLHFGCGTRSEEQPQFPVLSIEPGTSIDLGAIPADTKQRVEFTITNVSNRTLTGLKAVGSCGCTEETIDSDPLSPGERRVLSVAITVPSGAQRQSSVYLFCEESASTIAELTISGDGSNSGVLHVIPDRIVLGRSSDASVVEFSLSIRYSSRSGSPLFHFQCPVGVIVWEENRKERLARWNSNTIVEVAVMGAVTSSAFDSLTANSQLTFSIIPEVDGEYLSAVAVPIDVKHQTHFNYYPQVLTMSPNQSFVVFDLIANPAYMPIDSVEAVSVFGREVICSKRKAGWRCTIDNTGLDVSDARLPITVQLVGGTTITDVLSVEVLK